MLTTTINKIKRVSRSKQGIKIHSAGKESASSRRKEPRQASKRAMAEMGLRAE
jgi:hypothetical protein